MPAASAISNNPFRSGSGTQLASSTDQMTTNRFNARTTRASQPSEGRKNWTTVITPVQGVGCDRPLSDRDRFNQRVEVHATASAAPAGAILLSNPVWRLRGIRSASFSDCPLLTT